MDSLAICWGLQGSYICVVSSADIQKGPYSHTQGSDFHHSTLVTSVNRSIDTINMVIVHIGCSFL